MKVHSPELVVAYKDLAESLGEQEYKLGQFTVLYAVTDMKDQKPFEYAIGAAFPKIGSYDANAQAGGIIVNQDVPEHLQGL